jgi:hypothetical protein
MAAFPTPYDEPHLSSRRVPEGLRAVFGLHLTASSVSSAARRLVTLRLPERFAFRFGSDHVAHLAQHLNPRREEIPIIVDNRGKLPFESGGLFIGKLKVHTLDMGSDTDSARLRWTS